MPRLAHLLGLALHHGVAERLDAQEGEPPVRLLRAQATRLMLRAGLAPVDALWAVYTWSWALGQRPPVTTGPLGPQAGSRGRPLALKETAFRWLGFMLLLAVGLGAFMGLTTLLLGRPFWEGFLASLWAVGIPLLAMTVLRVWIFLVRLLFFDGIALLDRDVQAAEQALDEKADGAGGETP
jgi:hypothetical protein